MILYTHIHMHADILTHVCLHPLFIYVIVLVHAYVRTFVVLVALLLAGLAFASDEFSSAGQKRKKDFLS